MTAEEDRYSPPRPPMPRAALDASTDTAPGDSSPKGGGCLWVAGGLALIAVGIPMLVLPGPGIAAILGGVWMMGRGLGLVKPRR